MAQPWPSPVGNFAEILPALCPGMFLPDLSRSSRGRGQCQPMPEVGPVATGPSSVTAIRMPRSADACTGAWKAMSCPGRLVGRADGKAMPRRLAPIFRDREEFSAAQDLSAEVRAALAQSRSLVVVCSPRCRRLDLGDARGRTVPRAASGPSNPGRDPRRRAGREPAAALRQTNAAGEIVEPLAADFRKGGDGWAHGVLKLVAGIVGVGLDELVQRDSQRRMRRVTAVTAGALALVLVMGVLTVFALNARSEAERQRGEAEGLVEFMLTDLRTTLKGGWASRRHDRRQRARAEVLCGRGPEPAAARIAGAPRAHPPRHGRGRRNRRRPPPRPSGISRKPGARPPP